MAASGQVRYVSRRLESFDHVIRQVVEQYGFAREARYYGITTPARADEVRRGLRRSGGRLEVAVKAYTADCEGCRPGGSECRYHVLVTVYEMAAARDYMRRKADILQWGGRR